MGNESGLESTERSPAAARRDFSAQTSFARAAARRAAVSLGFRSRPRSPRGSRGEGKKKRFGRRTCAVSLVPNIGRRGAARRAAPGR